MLMSAEVICMTVRTVRAVFFDVIRRKLDPRAARHENHPHEHAPSSRNATAKRSARGRSDGQNDIEMRRGFGLGIAMGNACEEAKGAADYVIYLRFSLHINHTSFLLLSFE